MPLQMRNVPPGLDANNGLELEHMQASKLMRPISLTKSHAEVSMIFALKPLIENITRWIVQSLFMNGCLYKLCEIHWLQIRSAESNINYSHADDLDVSHAPMSALNDSAPGSICCVPITGVSVECSCGIRQLEVHHNFVWQAITRLRAICCRCGPSQLPIGRLSHARRAASDAFQARMPALNEPASNMNMRSITTSFWKAINGSSSSSLSPHQNLSEVLARLIIVRRAQHHAAILKSSNFCGFKYWRME